MRLRTTTDDVTALPVVREGGRAASEPERRQVLQAGTATLRTRRPNDLVEELGDALDSGYSERFEPTPTVLAGQIWRWQRGMAYLLRHEDIGHESASLLQTDELPWRTRSGCPSPASGSTSTAVVLNLKVDHARRGPELDPSRLDAKERRTLEWLVSKMAGRW